MRSNRTLVLIIGLLATTACKTQVQSAGENATAAGTATTETKGAPPPAPPAPPAAAEPSAAGSNVTGIKTDVVDGQLTVSLELDQAATVTGTPTLIVTVDGKDYEATYVSGTDPKVLTFVTKDVPNAGSVGDGDITGMTVVLGNATVTTTSGGPLILSIAGRVAYKCRLPWDELLEDGKSAPAFPAATVAFGSTCVAETRTCKDGVLSGTAAEQTCAAAAATSCALPWGGTLATGQSATAYKSAFATNAASCAATGETRTCTAGILSGTFENQACAVHSGFRVTTAAADGLGYSNGQAVHADVNGDGILDLVVGAHTANGERGRAYVVFGKKEAVTAPVDVATLDGTNGFYVEGAAATNRLGYALTTGDINHDGFSDLVLGAYQADPAGVTDAGACYVVFGKATGWGASLSVSALDGTNGFAATGTSAGSIWCGVSVAAADLNGDNYDDVICGCPRRNSTRGDNYVIFGKAGAYSATATLGSYGNGTTGGVVRGVNVNDLAGYSLATGDVNGDGIKDLLLGGYYTSYGASHAGSTYVFAGRAAWPGDGSATAGIYSLASLGSTHKIYRIDGNVANQQTAFTIASGNVNKDAYDDVVIGNLQSEMSYVVFGMAGTAWDALAGGIVSVSTLNGTTGFKLQSTAQSTYDSGTSPNGIGDINGDGYADVVVSASGGRGFVVFGKAGGWNASIDLTALAAGEGFEIASTVRGGVGAAYVTDVNADGYGDIVYGGTNQTVVIYGGPTGWTSPVDADTLLP